MFSVKPLAIIHEGVEKLAKARAVPGHGITITSLHATLFERLQRSFNNPNLLKEVGVAYLEEFRMPAMALKHFDLARQFAPKDRDIEQLQVASALAIARQMTDQSAHSGLDEAAPSKPEVSAILRRTSKLANVVDTRTHLDETAGELGRKQEVWRKTGAVKTSHRERATRRFPAADGPDSRFDCTNRLCGDGGGPGRGAESRRAEGGFAGLLRATGARGL